MPEYIEREAIKKYPIRLNNYDKKNGNYHFVLGIESVMEYVDCLPTADVQEVVRCKNCKCYELMTSSNQHFCNRFGGYVAENDYCSRYEK